MKTTIPGLDLFAWTAPPPALSTVLSLHCA